MIFNVESPISVNMEIEKIVVEKRMKYMEAIIYYCQINHTDETVVAKMLNPTICEKLRKEAEDLHFLPKVSRLPV